MKRILKTKNLLNAKMLKEYASWIYCESCGKTVAYLCYVSYDNFDFKFTCNCKKEGEVYIDFGSVENPEKSNDKLVKIKNRLSCPKDESPLLTIVEKNIQAYSYKISCLNCSKEYTDSSL